MLDFSEEELNWLDMQKMIIAAKPDFECIDVPQTPFRNRVHKIVSSNAFDIFIMSCIVLNMIQMALSFEGAPALYI